MNNDRLLTIKLINERIRSRAEADKPNKVCLLRVRLSEIDDAEFDTRINEEPIKKNPPRWTD